MSGSTATPTATVALSASSFDQSIGVNVHMGYTWTAYGDVALVESSLAYLGVDLVRDKLESPAYVNTAAYYELAAAGVKFDFDLPVYAPSGSEPNTVNISEFVGMIDSLVTAYPGSVSAIEGANEVNLWPATFDGGTTLADQAALQQALYAAVRADPNLNGIPVYNLTLAFTDASQYAQLGNLSAYANYANDHAYLNDAQLPQSALSGLLPYARLDAPGLPMVVTEAGYETNSADTYSGVDQTVQAKLTLDQLMDDFKDGVSETYLYELFDEGQQYFGLFNADGSPKLAATAIHNLTSILADPGSTSAFTPGSLTYAVANLPAAGNQLLLEKSNGNFDLVLWSEAQIWNPNTASEIVAPTQTSTVQFGQTQNVVLVFDPLSGTAPIAAYLNTQSVQVTLADHPLVIEVPGATPTLATPTINGYSSNGGVAGDSITLTGTASANSTVVVFDGAAEIGTAITNASGNWSFATGTLASGTNAFTSLAVDASGNVSAQSASFNVAISAAASAATIPVPIIFDYSVSATNQVILSGTAQANATVNVFDGATLLGSTSANASGAWSYTSASLASGDYTFAVTATDAAGNTSASSNSIDPLVAQPPTVSAVAASGSGISNGNLSSGSVITLTLIMSDAVTVTGGTPTLALTGGGTATYTGGSGTDALTFTYTAAAGDTVAGLTVSSINDNGADIEDTAGNALTGAIPTTAVAPTIASVATSGTGITNGNGDLNAGHVVALTLAMTEAVTVAGGAPTLTLNDGGTATYTGGSGSSSLTFSYTVAAGQNAADLAVTAVNLNSATIKDGAGNNAMLAGNLTPTGTLQIDTTSPSVASVAASGTGIVNGNGNLGAGSVVTLTLTMSEAVTVAGGTPSLTLNDGGTATYTGGSGSTALTFSYTVAAGQSTSDLAVNAVNLNGATIKDGAGNTASISGTLSPAGTLQITTTSGPTLVSLQTSGTGIANGNGDLKAGSAVTLTLTMSEAVTVAGGTPTLTLNDGGTATYTAGSGGTALTFSYTVAAGQNTADLSVSAVNLNGATIKDGGGNSASLSGTFSPAGTLQIDTTAPTVASVATSGAGIANGNGDLKTGSVVTLTLTMSEAVTVAGGTPTLTLNDGGTATYTGGSGGTALTFSYTVAAGQNIADLSVTSVNLNGATVKDGAGNSASLSGTFSPAGTLQIDTTAPTVASVATSGTGIANGNGDLKAGSVVALTLTMSEAVTVAGGTPTLTLNDGGTATYTGGSGSTALTFSYTVAAGQNTADLSVSAVNLNGATIKDGAGNSASLSGTLSPAGTLQIDTTAPTVASVMTSGTGITNGNGDLKAGSVVTLTLTMSEAVTVAGGTPTLTLNDGGTATYTGGSGGTTLTFSYTVAAGQNTADLSVSAVNLNGATIKDGAGNSASLSGTLSPTGTLQIDTAAVAAPVITSEKVVGRRAILTGTAEAGTTISVYEGTTLLGTTTANAKGAWAFATPTETNGAHSFTATATDAAGNVSASSNLIDPTIGAGPAATAAVVAVGSQYLLFNASGSSVPLVLNGSGLSVGQLGGWTPIAAVQTATGYDVAWQLVGTNQYTIWSTDSNGNYTANLVGSVSGTSTALESYETIFNQDLNGDGTIGVVTTVLQTDGSTSLTTQGNQYYLANGGSSVALQLNGSGIVLGQLGGWTPIGAVQTASGYDVAWQMIGTNQFTIWSTDSSGNYIANLVGVVSGSSAALEAFEPIFDQNLNGTGDLTTTVLQTDGSTSLTEVGNHVSSVFYLSSGGSLGPALQYQGADFVAGQLGGWTPIGAIQTASGYDIAWKVIGTNEYTIWSTDRNGNYTANLVGAVSGNSAALESFETLFNQDLNGDGTIGVVTTVIRTNGSTSLVTEGNQYFLKNGGSNIAIELAGAGILVGQLGGWTPIGAVQTATGYDVAWQLAGSNQFTVWSIDSNGNYTANLVGSVSGTSTALESYETIFNQDLNGDGTIGVVTTVLQTDGSTSLTTQGNQYYLANGGSSVALQLNGAGIVVGQLGGWTPIGAVQTASGYDVAWKMIGTNQFTIWSTDSSGNYIANLVGVVSGSSAALEAFEPIFDQNLNGTGDLTTTVIQTDGSTSLTEVGNHVSSVFYLSSGGSLGPALQFQNADFVAGQFGGWTPIGAIQTGSGYDIALKDSGSGEYTIWSTDRNGNYIANLIGAVSGNSTALESFETLFNQDLNGDGVTGVYAAPGTTQQITTAISGVSASATIGAGAALEISAADSGPVTFAASTGTLKLDSPSTFSGTIFAFTGNGTLSGSDQIDLTNVNFNSVHDSYVNGVLTVTDGTNTDTLGFNGSYVLANFKFASDGNGGTIVYDPPVPPAGDPGTYSSQTPTWPAFNSTSNCHDSGVPDGVAGAGFNTLTLGYSQNSSQTGGTLAGADSSRCALLGNYIASSLVSSEYHFGDMTVPNGVPWGSPPALANPHHS